MPARRASTAIAKANCWQYPVLFLVRKSISAAGPCVDGTFSEYRKRPGVVNQFCIATALP